jgi:hypothetical protein
LTNILINLKKLEKNFLIFSRMLVKENYNII